MEPVKYANVELQTKRSAGEDMLSSVLLFMGLRGFVWVSPDGKQCNSLCGKGIQTSSGAEKWSIFRIG